MLYHGDTESEFLIVDLLIADLEGQERSRSFQSPIENRQSTFWAASVVKRI